MDIEKKRTIRKPNNRNRKKGSKKPNIKKIVSTDKKSQPQPTEFTDEWFNMSNKRFIKNKKIFKNRKIYYKSNDDSPITKEEVMNLKKRITPYDPSPNANTWSQCGYISNDGKKCISQGIFYQNEIDENPQYDYEKYSDVHFCSEHSHLEEKEKEKAVKICCKNRLFALFFLFF